MRIVYIYPTLATWGGVERILVDKMNMLARLYNYEIYVLTYNQGEHVVPFQLDNRVCHIDLKVRTHAKYSYRGFRRVWEGFRRQNLLRQRLRAKIESIVPDIIITTTSGELGMLLKIKKSIPLIVESHGGYDHLIDFPFTTWWHRHCLRKCRKLLHKANAIISLTESDAQKWKKDYSNIFVIPNIAHLNPTGSYSNCTNKRAIFVGRFAEQKGIPELLAVWRLVHESYPDWQLHMYGEGNRSYFPQEDIGVIIHEPTSDIFNQYVVSSMLILTSRWEPFGLVIPEAMSCGLPVVSFEGDGPSSIITDGHDGFVIGKRSIERMANRICFLIAKQELRQQMGQNAIVSSQRYTAENIMPKWKKLFESLVNE